MVSLETPHPPYELLVTAEARKPAVWAGETASEKQVQAPFLASRQLRLTLGAGTAPPGLEAALSSMRAGERASVWTAPEEGAFSALPELPRACPDGVEWTLWLEEVVQVRDMYGDGSLLKRRLLEGSGTFPVDCPIHDCVVRVHVAVFVGDFANEQLDFVRALARVRRRMRCVFILGASNWSYLHLHPAMLATTFG